MSPRVLRSHIIGLSILCAGSVWSEPISDSWLFSLSGRYAQIYPDREAEASGDAVTTWARGQGTQSLPTYAGVHEVSEGADSIYVRSTGLGFHTMGPWYGETGNLFPNYPANRAGIFRFPKTPQFPATKVATGLGTIGLFVDGVSMFDSRDAFSYDTSQAQDDRPNAQQGVNGDGVWNRDAFVNESVTFDPANAHQAGLNYHYHANPPALRHLLGGSVAYDEATNRYTESANGEHSPLIGWVEDGLPIYGPYGYSSPLDAGSGVRRMISGYQTRDGSRGSINLTTQGRTSLPQWRVRNEGGITTTVLAGNFYGPAVSEAFPLGHYVEDYAYKGDLSGYSLYDGSGLFSETQHFDLNEYNVRWCVTPEFPEGTWAYFSAILSDGTPTFPYNIGLYYYADPTGGAVNTVPNDARVIHQAGPERPSSSTVSAGDQSGDVVLMWSSVAGGNYVVEESSSLDDDWEALAIVDAVTSESSVVDSQRLNVENTHFYRTKLNYIRPFDDNGFVYDSSILGTGPQPNVLLLILDDWGVDASELYNTEQGVMLAQMPNLRAIAERGLRFTRGYAQPICSPTRATILTGRSPYRTGVTNPTGNNTLGASEITIPEALTSQAPAYGLASFGKWHLGSGNTGPFDTGGWPNFAGTLQGGVSSYTDWDEVKIENGTLVSTTARTTYATTAQVDSAKAFIDAQGDNPWFVWMGFNAPHSPFEDPEPHVIIPGGYSTAGTSNLDLYVKSLEALDHEVGRLLESVDLANTNIIVIGDNGTPGQVVQAPFGNGNAKATLFEGGINVPFFAAGPDVVRRGTSDKLVHVVDLFSTILEMAGVNSNQLIDPSELDSRTLLPLLRGGTDAMQRCIVSEQWIGTGNNDGRSLISDEFPNFKLISFQDITDANDLPRYEMYDLSASPDESQGLVVPPVSGDAHFAAYEALTAKDESLQPAVAASFFYLELQAISGPASPPANLGVAPTSVTIDGVEVASIEGRLNATDTADRYWVKVGVADASAVDLVNSEAIVTFPDNPNSGDARQFTAISIEAAP